MGSVLTLVVIWCWRKWIQSQRRSGYCSCSGDES